MNINKLQKEFLKSKLLNDIGISPNQADNVTLNVTEKTLFRFKTILEDKLRENLKLAKKKASGQLGQLGGDVITNGDVITYKLYIQDYYINVNDGRKGKKQKWTEDPNLLIGKRKQRAKMPPFEPISNWVRFKNLAKLSYKGLGFKTRQTSRVSDKVKKMQLVDAIRYKIYRDGIEPTYFYSTVINKETIATFKESLAKQLGKNIILDIKL